MLIKSAAHFSVCACGQHGKLITADGEESRELCSKEKARRAFDQAVKNGKIGDYEVCEALRQINMSSIAETEEDAPLIAQVKVAAINEIEDLWMAQAEEPVDPHHIN